MVQVLMVQVLMVQVLMVQVLMVQVLMAPARGTGTWHRHMAPAHGTGCHRPDAGLIWAMTDIKIPVFDQVASAEAALDKLQERYDAATAAIRKALDA